MSTHTPRSYFFKVPFPYQSVYTMKLPGTSFAYSAIFLLFGQTAAAIHLGLLLVNAATILLVYVLAKRLFGAPAGVVAAATYGLLSTSPSVMGFAAHATHFVMLPALGGILLLLRGLETKKTSLLFASGILAGLAILMKQPGIFFALFCGIYLVLAERREDLDWRKITGKVIVFSLGVLFPLACLFLFLFRAGVFQTFWFWTFSYARQYSSSIGIADGIQMLIVMLFRVARPAWWIWAIAGVGLWAVWWDPRSRAQFEFLASFVFFSLLAVCPGFYFRPHYFILMLPAVALMAGLAVGSSTRRLDKQKPSLRLVPVCLFCLAFASALIQQRQYLFQMGPIAACRAVYGMNPFPEAVQIASYIRAHTSNDEKIAVLGSEPEYLFLFRPTLSHWLHLYLWINGESEIRPSNAKGNGR